MITIHASKSTDGVIRGIIGALRENMAKNPAEHHIVIVPDNAALFIELKIMKELNLIGTFNIEAASLMRLAKKYLDLSGVLTEEGAAMILKRIATEESGALSCFKKSVGSAGFLKEAYDIIRGIRNNRIDAEKIKSISADLPQKLKHKLDDVIYLYNGYIKEMSEKHGDSLSYLEKMYLKVGDMEHIISARIYILLYDGFSALEYDIIEKLMKYAPSVDIGIVGNEGAPNAAIYAEDGLFYGIAARAGEYSYRVISHDAELPIVFEHIADNLYSYAKCKKIQSDGAVRLIEAKSPHDEALYTAREINRMIDDTDIDYSDIAVVIPDISKYAPYIKAIFSRFEIPYALSAKKSAALGALAKFIKAASEIYKKNYHIVPFLEFIKNPYFDIDAALAGEFENYCARKNVEYLYSPLDDAQAEELRLRALSSARFFEKPNEIINAKEFFRIVEEFFNGNGVFEKTDGYADSASAEDAYYRIQCCKKIVGILNEMTRVFSETKLSAGDFSDILLSQCAASDVAPLQQKLNVYIGGTQDGVFDKKVLFILGADAGAFPKERKKSKIISEREESLLKEQGVVFDAPEGLTARAVKLMSSPKERLYVMRNTAGGGYAASVFGKLEGIFSDVKIENPEGASIYKDGTKERQTDGFIYLASRRSNLLYTMLSEADNIDAETEELFSAAYSALKDDEKTKFDMRLNEDAAQCLGGIDSFIGNAKELFFKNKSIRVTQVEKYYACPYLHFLQYGLRLGEDVKSELEARDTGNIIHDVLDGFVVKSKDMLKEEAIIFADRVIDGVLARRGFIEKLDSPKNLNVKKRMKKDLLRVCADLHAFISNSDFKPAYTEAAISEGGLFKPLQLKNGVKLTGKIDRTDICGDYVSVIDYKTGSVKGNVLSDVYYGNRLQLFIYAATLREDKKLKCAAALYMKIKDGFLKEEDVDGRYRAVGVTLLDRNVMGMLDNDIKNGAQKSRILPVKITSDEKLAEDNAQSALTEHEFTEFCKLSVMMAERAAAEIEKGYIAKKPSKNGDYCACEYCVGKIICGAKKIVRSQMPLKKEEIAEILRNSLSDLGYNTVPGDTI
ncbi:MAG: exodeoxyribonuclease V subunit gamma [Clostridiales bacterium]|jgi:ATP-dependent helicase/nuclease subunit B|nr:exodeoxyribonuclease V subunit gamma [Clostridiales bacterium]